MVKLVFLQIAFHFFIKLDLFLVFHFAQVSNNSFAGIFDHGLLYFANKDIILLG
jgi:hypothetical protein